MSTLEQSLIADIPRLSEDEQKFVRYILDRVLIVGRRSYSPWVAANDTRDMKREAADEAADHVVYVAMDAVMRAVRKRDRVDAFIAAAELAEMSPVMPLCIHNNTSDPAFMCTPCWEGDSSRQGGETVAAPRFEISVPNNGSTEGDAYTPSVSVGRAGSTPAPDTHCLHTYVDGVCVDCRLPRITVEGGE